MTEQCVAMTQRRGAVLADQPLSKLRRGGEGEKGRRVGFSTMASMALLATGLVASTKLAIDSTWLLPHLATTNCEVALAQGFLPFSPAPQLPFSPQTDLPLTNVSDAPSAEEPSEVSFELLRSLHIAVDVTINDAGPRRLIFDLGAPINLVSGRFAAEAGLITKEAAERPALFGMRGDKIVKKFQVGDVVAENVTVMIMDHPTIKAVSEILGPIDGIVGYPFFARYRFTIDYPAKTMTFSPGDYQPQNVMQQMISRMLGSRDPKKRTVIAPASVFGIAVEKPDGDDAPGVLVTDVYAASPAAAAGLRAGDRLLTLDGRWTDSVTDVYEAASFVKAGQEVAVVIRRNEQHESVNVHPSLGI